MADGGPPTSNTRLYLGNLPPNATKADIENHFAQQGGANDIEEVKLMNGFGFIEYKDAMVARDVVPALHGSDFMGNRLVVQFARGSRPRDTPFYPERPAPRTRRTVYRMTVSGLPQDTSWQDLKDFARLDGLDVVYSEVARERDGKGFVEYETEPDLKNAVEKIDGREFRGATVQCLASIQAERPRDRFRSRSPPRRGYGPPGGGYDDHYGDRRGPPRGHSPRGYRERSPPPQRRGHYDEERPRYGGGRRSPPPARGPPVDDYPPPRRSYPDDYPPPRGGAPGGYGGRAPYEADAPPYANGGGAGAGGHGGGHGGSHGGHGSHRGGYDRGGQSPRRQRSPGGRGGYDGGYEQRRNYW